MAHSRRLRRWIKGTLLSADPGSPRRSGHGALRMRICRIRHQPQPMKLRKWQADNYQQAGPAPEPEPVKHRWTPAARESPSDSPVLLPHHFKQSPYKTKRPGYLPRCAGVSGSCKQNQKRRDQPRISAPSSCLASSAACRRAWFASSSVNVRSSARNISEKARDF